MICDDRGRLGRGRRRGIELAPLASRECEALISGHRLAHWAGDYPTDGDRFVARNSLYRSEVPPWCHYHVVLPGGLLIGGAGFHGAPVNEMVEIGYGIVGSQRGRGYASEAVALLVELCEGAPEVGVIRATTTPTNLASQRVLVHNGFQLAGTEAGALVYLRSVE
ncbi:MAG: GNAT family N-acetyltransferase [Ferrimicrobium sp.]|uniref:GNAT family N-acetyltransferase n=1 Tax=Ferrimicrobium acidiphilum TaxID=121039 RepID=A0ABV3Y5B8_9ACTN|nr:GNAT family N-acetyltransferase [Ferrimicrobium sp.]MCL5973280.1 GNAT family N-acetyltransferase [Actinomycetota bacterium]